MIDPDEKLDDNVAKIWLFEHRYLEVQTFLDEFINYEVQDQAFLEMLESPLASYRLVIQNEMTNTEKTKIMLDSLSKAGTITICIGAKGGGKTALITGRIVPDLLTRGKNVCYCGMPQTYPKFLGNHPLVKRAGSQIIFKYDYLSVAPGHTIIQDESSIIENAKNYADKQQKEREDILPIIRHKDNSIIFISQQFAFVSKRIRDFVDCFIIKPFNLMQLLKDNQDYEFPFPKIVQRLIPRDNTELLFIHNTAGILHIKHDIASFYKNNPDKWGKSFKNIENDQEAHEFIDALLNNNYTPGKTRHLLRLRGFEKWTLQDYKKRAEELGITE